jgi:hypothetical protein
MNLDFALIRKEADTYRSQGLYQEALELYAAFVARSIEIDVGTKSAIQKQVRLIELEMNCGDTGVTHELPADRTALTQKGRGERAIESDFLLYAQDQAEPPGCNQKEKFGVNGLDWADGMADIYALVADDTDPSFSENVEKKSVFAGTQAPKVLRDPNSPQKKRFHRDVNLKSFLKGIAAFVLVGSIFFYFVDWLSDFNKDRSGEPVQKTAKMVLKKIPPAVDNEDTSALPNNATEDTSATRREEAVDPADTRPAVGPVAAHEVIGNLSSSGDDPKRAAGTPGGDFQLNATRSSEMPAVENSEAGTSPEEPDPASVIDYVLKKRGR